MVWDNFISILNNLWQIILGLLTTLGGTGAVVWFIADHIAKNKTAKQLESIKSKYSQELELLKTQLEIAKRSAVRFSDKQFEIYSELWASLVDLKIRADKLWEEANGSNLEAFSKQLKSTQKEIDLKSIFIEKEHYERLKTLLTELAEYDTGKFKLINARRGNDDPYLINQVISENRTKVEAYTNIIDSLRIEFNNQLHLGQVTDKEEQRS